MRNRLPKILKEWGECGRQDVNTTCIDTGHYSLQDGKNDLHSADPNGIRRTVPGKNVTVYSL